MILWVNKMNCLKHGSYPNSGICPVCSGLEIITCECDFCVSSLDNIKQAAEEVANWSKEKLENAHQAFSEPMPTKPNSNGKEYYEFEYRNLDNPTCPYCDYEYDSSEYNFYNKEMIICNQCENKFELTTQEFYTTKRLIKS